MTHFQHYLSGKIFGIKYMFDNVGDKLPEHVHDDITAHNIIVMQGSVKVVFEHHTVRLQEGDVYDFDGSKKHTVIATEPYSSVLNLFLNGQPEQYKQLPESELSGEFDLSEVT